MGYELCMSYGLWAMGVPASLHLSRQPLLKVLLSPTRSDLVPHPTPSGARVFRCQRLSTAKAALAFACLVWLRVLCCCDPVRSGHESTRCLSLSRARAVVKS